MKPCCLCGKEACIEIRIIPRRTTEPLTDCIRRALAWPGAAEPVTVYGCQDHQKAVRDAAVVVLGSETLGSGVTRITYVDEAVNATVVEE